MFKNTPYAQAFLKKQAFVPYTQEAMNPPAPQGGGPAAAGAMPPEVAQQPPTEGAGAPPAQAAPMQIVQGPNGAPVDAETGFIVLDQQLGIKLELKNFRHM